jgi:large subunit ribosomal protein L3
MLKCGMTCDYDAWGVRRALTVLRAEAPVVVGHATAALRGYDAVAVGAGTAKRPRAPARGAARASGLAAAGRAPPAVTAEFRVSADALAALPVGAALGVRHWVPGQFVDVRGTSQGKGFQGGERAAAAEHAGGGRRK